MSEQSTLTDLGEYSASSNNEDDTCSESCGNALTTTLSDKWHAAVFILSIKEQHLLTQSAVDRVISSTTTLISRMNQGILHDLQQTCRDVVPEDMMAAIQSRVKRTESLFAGISTAYEQKKFFKDCFNLVVSNNNYYDLVLMAYL